MNRRQFFAAILLAGCVQALAGCGASAAKRPLIRENGRALSQLLFPEGVSQITLPLQSFDGLLVTDAIRINGQSVGPMAIDTGAGWTCLDHKTAERLGISEKVLWKRSKLDTAPDGLYRIDSLDIGPLKFSDHVVGVVDLSSLTHNGVSVAGALGGDVFGALPFTYDYQQESLTIYKREHFKPPAGAGKYRLTVNRPATLGSFVQANPAAGQPLVDGRIDGIGVKLLLDTGFANSVVLRPAFAMKHPRFIDLESKVVGKVSGAAGPRGLEGRELKRANVDRTETLGVAFVGAGTATVLSGESDGAMWKRDQSAAILGISYLIHGRLTFDYATGRVWAEWREPSSTPATTRAATTQAN